MQVSVGDCSSVRLWGDRCRTVVRYRTIVRRTIVRTSTYNCSIVRYWVESTWNLGTLYVPNNCSVCSVRFCSTPNERTIEQGVRFGVRCSTKCRKKYEVSVRVVQLSVTVARSCERSQQRALIGYLMELLSEVAGCWMWHIHTPEKVSVDVDRA